MKERKHYMFCSDCGYAFKEDEIFKRAYKNTAICLCRECALKLAQEITDKYGKTIADKDNNDELCKKTKA